MVAYLSLVMHSRACLICPPSPLSWPLAGVASAAVEINTAVPLPVNSVSSGSAALTIQIPSLT